MSSCEFNRLKQKLQSNSNSPKGSIGGQNNKKGNNKIKVKILDKLSKHSSDTTNTIANTTGSSDS